MSHLVPGLCCVASGVMTSEIRVFACDRLQKPKLQFWAMLCFLFNCSFFSISNFCFCFCFPGFELYSMVPSICPLETLHNALSLKQVDEFLASVASPSSEVPHTAPEICRKIIIIWFGRYSYLNIKRIIKQTQVVVVNRILEKKRCKSIIWNSLS